MSAAGTGISIDLKQRWSHSEQRMVPLDVSVYNAITAAIPLRKPQKSITLFNSITTVDATRNVTHMEQENRMPGQVLLTNTIVPINVLIDTGFMQTNVLSERIGNLLRADGSKAFETDAALTSGVGGISYGVQGLMTLMIALPIDAPPSQYRHVWLGVSF